MSEATEDISSHIRRKVKEYGWTRVASEGEHGRPAWAHSIGLFRSYAHPEVIVVGLGDEQMYEVLSAMAGRVQVGEVYEPAHEYDDVVPGHRCAFETVDPRYYADYLARAVQFYEGALFPALQCIWADPIGRYPWDTDFDEHLRPRQPLLLAPDQDSQTTLLGEPPPGQIALDSATKIADDRPTRRLTAPLCSIDQQPADPASAGERLTRRLELPDNTDLGEPSYRPGPGQAPSPERRCLRCAQKLIVAEWGSEHSPDLPRSLHRRFGGSAWDRFWRQQPEWLSVPCYALVCTRCGYVEFYAPEAHLLDGPGAEE